MQIDKYVEEFTDTIANGDNQSTVNRYEYAVRGWLEWLEEEGIGVWDADGLDLKRHLNHLMREGYSQSYAKVRRSVVSRFHQELAPDHAVNPSDDTDMQWSELGGYEKETQLRDRDYYVDDEEFNAMLENVPTPQSRNVVILKTLRRAGLRRGELVTLREQDLDERNGVIRIHRHKTDESVGIPVPDGLMLELTRWRDVGRKTMGGYDPDADWLFPSEKAPKINEPQINEIVKESADGAGIQETIYRDAADRERKKITSHALRFSAAKDLQDKGIGIDKIQTFLGHADVSTTEHYLRDRESAMQDAVRDAFE